MDGSGKGTLCVTGGTGFLMSWLILKLLRLSVNTTIFACLNAKTVMRVVYTSSVVKGLDIVDESAWKDIDYIRSSNRFGWIYSISKTLTEKACLEFAEKHGLDLVTVLPSWIHGPFITPHLPGSVRSSMAMILGEQEPFHVLDIPFVHTDDVVRAHIFLFEYLNAEGSFMKKIERHKIPAVSSKKLLGTGCKFGHGLEVMYDDTI